MYKEQGMKKSALLHFEPNNTLKNLRNAEHESTAVRVHKPFFFSRQMHGTTQEKQLLRSKLCCPPTSPQKLTLFWAFEKSNVHILGREDSWFETIVEKKNHVEREREREKVNIKKRRLPQVSPVNTDLILITGHWYQSGLSFSSLVQRIWNSFSKDDFTFGFAWS